MIDKVWFWIYGTIFLAFGLGVKLTQLKEMPNGFIFLGLGFLLLIISLFVPMILCKYP